MGLADLKDRQATLAAKLITIPVDRSTSGDGTAVRVVEAGKLFAVYGFYLKASGAVSVKWKSGSTDITGAVPLAVTLADDAVWSLLAEIPVCKARTHGDDLFLNLSGNVAVTGFVMLTETSI